MRTSVPEPPAGTVAGAGPEDVIAAVWFALDRRPRNSLVLAGLHGPRRRLGAMLRCDLNGSEVPFALPRPGPALTGMLDRLRETGAVALIAVIFADWALEPPARRLAGRLQDRIDEPVLLDVLGVTPSAYASLLCPDPVCCPPAGHPIDEVTASRAAVLHVVAGHQVVREPTPTSAPALALVPAPAFDRVDWYLRWCRALVGAQPPEGLAAALADGFLRDAVLLNLLGAPARWINELLEAPGEAGTESFVSALGDDDAAADRLEELLSRRPGEDRIERGEAVLEEVLDRAAPGEGTPVVAVLAMLAWLDGREVRAVGLVRQGLAAGPELHLLRLVAELLARRISPPWRDS
jgi:hypothetical protein